MLPGGRQSQSFFPCLASVGSNRGHAACNCLIYALARRLACETGARGAALLYLFYPGAVYDGDNWSKAKLGVFGLLAVRRLAGGADGDFLRAAWMYSRQVEHSDANLERLETYVRESRSCALPQMLACLLGE